MTAERTPQANSAVRTPCVGTCSTVFGDVVCRGCRRFLHEVRDWNTYDADARTAVWARLRAFAEQVLGSRVAVIDPEALRRAADRVGVRIVEQDSDLLVALRVLRQTARHLRRIEEIGLVPLAADSAPEALLAEIERDLQAVAEAHYERYFAPQIVF